jgi:predicted nucleic acid-binding protein
MTALVFVDTNVLVYARDPRDAIKRARAGEWIRMLWNEQRGRTSVQVLSEYYDVVTRKFARQIGREDAWDDVQRFLAWNPQAIDSEVLVSARGIEDRHRLSWWDCLIVAAAQAQGCALLLTEDLQDKANYGGVTVRNPFLLAVAEEGGAYLAPPRLASRHRGRGRPRKSAKRSISATS